MVKTKKPEDQPTLETLHELLAAALETHLSPGRGLNPFKAFLFTGGTKTTVEEVALLMLVYLCISADILEEGALLACIDSKRVQAGLAEIFSKWQTSRDLTLLEEHFRSFKKVLSSDN